MGQNHNSQLYAGVFQGSLQLAAVRQACAGARVPQKIWPHRPLLLCEVSAAGEHSSA